MRQLKTWESYERLARSQAIAALTHSPSTKAVLAQNNLSLFGQLISNLTPAAHHTKWLTAIDTNTNSTALNRIAGPNLRIAAPRGAAKTTWISIAIAWIIGHNPQIRIILCSYSEEIAVSISVAIKQIIQSPTYQEIFPLVRPSKRWRDKAWTINRTNATPHNNQFIKDPTLLAVGAGGSIASRRADLIIIDDPIKSSEAIANKEIREALVTWWYEVLKPCLIPKGRAIALCTRYRLDDIHGTDWNEAKGWTTITQSAIIQAEVSLSNTNTEASYWPQYISLEELQTIRDDNPTAFASQYQNNPLDLANAIINPEWITRGELPSKFEALILGVDLAISKRNSADYTALVLCGKSANKFYAIALSRGRWTLFETIEEIFKLQHQHGTFRILVESVAYQAAFINEYKRIATEKGIRLKCDAITPSGDKESRLRGISGLLESNKVIFNEAANLGQLIEELLYFGVSAHDDTVDAFIYAIAHLYQHRKALTGGSY